MVSIKAQNEEFSAIFWWGLSLLLLLLSRWEQFSRASWRNDFGHEKERAKNFLDGCRVPFKAHMLKTANSYVYTELSYAGTHNSPQELQPMKLRVRFEFEKTYSSDCEGNLRGVATPAGPAAQRDLFGYFYFSSLQLTK